MVVIMPSFIPHEDDHKTSEQKEKMVGKVISVSRVLEIMVAVRLDYYYWFALFVYIR